MKFFTKQELKGLAIILLLIFAASLPNFLVSLRRSRDAQRKADLGTIHDSLLRYQADFGSFPISKDNKIAACEPVEKKIVNGLTTFDFSPCAWGKDALKDLSDLSYPAYIQVLPLDPNQAKGVGYLYFSNGSRFQVYAALEGKNEDEYDPKIIKRNLNCGSRICNFGRSYAKTPLDKSIQEYENEINAKK
jgi:type II secretory pathway pseudopilin PulG